MGNTIRRLQKRNSPYKTKFLKKGMIQLYFLALVPLIFVIIFNYLPMGGLLMAFKDYSIRKGVLRSPWAEIFQTTVQYSDFSSNPEKYDCAEPGIINYWISGSYYLSSCIQ